MNKRDYIKRTNDFMERLKEELKYEQEKHVFTTPIQQQIIDNVKALEDMIENPDKYKIGE